MNDTKHPLYGHTVPENHLKSRFNFIHDTDALIKSPSTRRIEMWHNPLHYVPHTTMQTPRESLASGASGTWLGLKCLIRPCTHMARSKHNMKQRKHIEDDDTTRECKGSDQPMDHFLGEGGFSWRIYSHIDHILYADYLYSTK